MKRASSIFLFMFLWLTGYSEDTIRIKSLIQYKEGKINILVSPTGRQTIVNILDKSNTG